MQNFLRLSLPPVSIASNSLSLFFSRFKIAASHICICVYINIFIYLYIHITSLLPLSLSLFLSFSFSLVLFARLVTLSPFNVTILPLAFSFARSSIVYFCPARIQRRSSLPSLSPVRARPTTPTRKHEVSRREPNGCSGTSGSVTNLASIVPEFFSAARSFAVRSPFDRAHGEP